MSNLTILRYRLQVDVLSQPSRTCVGRFGGRGNSRSGSASSAMDRSDRSGNSDASVLAIAVRSLQLAVEVVMRLVCYGCSQHPGKVVVHVCLIRMR